MIIALVVVQILVILVGWHHRNVIIQNNREIAKGFTAYNQTILKLRDRLDALERGK